MKGWIAAVLFIGAISLFTWWILQKQPINTDQINGALMRIVKSQTVAEREIALNDALIQIDQKNPTMGNGNYYLALGDVYKHFNALPWASWSYRQAASLAPNHPVIMERIQSVDKALQIHSKSQDSIFDQLLFFHLFSIPRRLQLFTLSILLALSFLSLAIWQKKTLWTVAGTVCGVVALIFLMSSLYTRYIEPVQAVVIEGALVLSAPADNAAMIGSSPIPAGSAILVMNIAEDGRFVRVMTDEGSLGYVPIQKLRLIH